MNVFPRFEYRMSYVLYPFVTYFLILRRTLCHQKVTCILTSLPADTYWVKKSLTVD
jgi:hypothetical protein